MKVWNQHTEMNDGLLGFPGDTVIGGAHDWTLWQLESGDVWYAPRSGWYLVTGSGGGGAGSGYTSNGNTTTGGGSGGGLINAPVWIPQGVGGVVSIGAGGASTSANGENTTFGVDLMIFAGGTGGTINGGYPAHGSVSGRLLTRNNKIVYSASGSPGYYETVGSGVGYMGGANGGMGVLADNAFSIANGILTGRFSKGGHYPTWSTSGNPGEAFGAGGSAGTNGTGGNGAAGCLFIAWTGILTPGNII